MIPASEIDAELYNGRAHKSSVRGGVVTAETPRRGSIFCKVTKIAMTVSCVLGFVAFAKADAMLDSIERGNAQVYRLVHEIVSSGQAEERARQIESQRTADRASSLASMFDSAVYSGSWRKTIEVVEEMVGTSEPEKAGCYGNLRFAMLYWNLGESNRAIRHMTFCVDQLAEEAQRYGRENRGVKRAQVLLEKMKRGAIPGKFSVNDITGYNQPSVLSFIMRPINDAIGAYYQKQTAHLDRLNAAMDAEIDVYRKEGRHQAMMATFNAEMDYLRSVNKTFDPDNQPPRGSADREKWDECKRIYDIFCTKEPGNPSTTSTTFSSSTDSSSKPSYGESNHRSRVCRSCGGTGKKKLPDADTLSRLSPDEGRAFINALYHPECSSCKGKGIIQGLPTPQKSAVKEPQKLSMHALPEANKLFGGIDKLFEDMMSRQADEIRLAPGDDLATAICRSSGRTTIRLQAGRYILGGEKGTCEIGSKIRLFGAGRGQTIVVGNFTVKPGEEISLVLKDLTLTGPTEEKEETLEVGRNSAVIFDNVELKCAVGVGMDGFAVGRKVRQFLRNSFNYCFVDSHCVFIDSIFVVSGSYAFHAGSSHVGFKNCKFVGTKNRKGSQSVCFLGYGVDGHVPFYVSQSFIMDFDVVFKSFTSEGVSRRNGIYMNDVQLKGCKSIVEGGTCKAYRLRMLDMEANESFIEHVETPLDIPASWK